MRPIYVFCCSAVPCCAPFFFKDFRGSARRKPKGWWRVRVRLLKSADRKKGQRKGATSKNVKKCQKYFRHFSTFFVQGKKRQKSSKNIKKYFRHFSTIFAQHPFSGPFWGGCDFKSATAQGQHLQLKQTSDATSLLRPCCRASVSYSGKGTLDMASRAPRDEGRSCRCRPLDVSSY